MRIKDDVLKCVAFVGSSTTDENGHETFVPSGTAFFLMYEGVAYTVTARHVAEAIKPPFTIRAIDLDGNSVSLDVLHVGWFYHPDEDVARV